MTGLVGCARAGRPAPSRVPPCGLALILLDDCAALFGHDFVSLERGYYQDAAGLFSVGDRKTHDGESLHFVCSGWLMTVLYSNNQVMQVNN